MIGSPSMPTSRRHFLQGAACVAGVAASTALAPRLAFASPSNPARGDAVVVVNLRGGADGLSFTPPTSAAFDSYRAIRPGIHITPDQALPLDNSNVNARFPQGMSGTVGLHPALRPLHETVWARGEMAVIPAAGFPDSESQSRSHFEAQRFWDYGAATGGVRTGWLNRVMRAQPASAPVAGVSKSNNTSRLFRGTFDAYAVPNVDRFGLDRFRQPDEARAALMALHAGSGLVNQVGASTLGVVSVLDAIDGGTGPVYPDGNTGRHFREVANMLKADIGLITAVIDIGGWDHHDELGGPLDPDARFTRKARELGDGLMAFINHMGDDMAETTIIVVSEFGRTIDENGNGGTDHGRGGTTFIIGGGVQGGVFGNDYPDEIVDSRENRRALPVLTDWRQPVAEILATRTGATGIYPTFTAGDILGVSRT